MYLGRSENRYGTPVSKHKCHTCGNEFTICPSAPGDTEDWDNCLAWECESYDVTRDADLFFAAGQVKRTAMDAPVLQRLSLKSRVAKIGSRVRNAMRRSKG